MTAPLLSAPPSPLDDAFGVALAGTAAQHGGVVLTHEAREAGYSPEDVSRRLRRRIWVRVRRGAYVTARRWDDADERVRHLLIAQAVVLSLEGSTHLTHVSGLMAHGVDLLRPDLSLVHVIRSGAAVSGRLEGGCAHSTADLPEEQRGSALGLPVAVPERCLFDYARHPAVSEDQAVVALDSALGTGHATRGGLAALVEQYRDWAGSLAACRSISAADGRAGSAGESLLRLVLGRVGLLPEDLQIEVRTPEGTYYADMGWRSLRVLLEFDGKEKFGRWRRPGETPADAAWRERRRELALERAGWIVVRVCWADLFDEARLRALVLEAFARAARRTSS